MKRPILVASNVLLTDSGEILLGLRQDRMLWEVPGGKVENETVVEAGRREQREETGMELLGEPAAIGFSDSWKEDSEQGRPWYVCQFLLWSCWRGFPRLLEGKHLEWRWFKLQNLPLLEQLSFGTRVLVTTYLARRSRFIVGHKPVYFPSGDGDKAA